MSEHPHLSSTLVSSANCSNLRHKGMYVLSAPDPDEFAFYDRYNATAYWCTCTQQAVGPDGRPVHPDECRSGRVCCEPSG
jgi:hypothetical protein